MKTALYFVIGVFAIFAALITDVWPHWADVLLGATGGMNVGFGLNRIRRSARAYET